MAACSQAILHGAVHNILSPKSESLSSFKLPHHKLRHYRGTYSSFASRRGILYVSAKRAAPLELLPVSPDDDTQVTFSFLTFFLGGIILCLYNVFILCNSQINYILGSKS